MSNGFLVIGDIHNEYAMFKDAVEFASANDLRFVSVGDLVDYGPDPFDTISLAYSLAKTTDAVFIEGNHDNKISRYILGNDITISHGLQVTVDLLNTSVTAKDLFKFVHSQMLSYFRIGNTVITHGGVHPDFWNGITDSKAVKSTFLYGQIDRSRGTVLRNGMEYPHRVYDWTKSIPKDKIVIVGHDRSPFEEIPQFDSNINKIVVRKNNLGGEVIFTDTGSGKGGFISGVVLDTNGHVSDMVTFQK